MPNKPPYRTSRDPAGLQHRYEKLMKIFSLPEEEARRQALSDFLAQIRSQRQEEERAPAGGDVGRQDEPPLEDFFTDITSEREGRSLILPGGRRAPDRNLVYSDFNGMLVFIPRDRAFYLAKIHRAMYEAATWGAFRKAVPPEVYADALERTEAQPGAGDSFSPEQIAGWNDGDWPAWPAQEMLGWMPPEIQEDLGESASSFVNGPCLYIKPNREQQAVAALQANGFGCKRDELLVSCACGHVPEEE